MYSNIFKLRQRYKLAIIIVFISSLFPLVAHSACGALPSTYPLYSDTKLNLAKDITVNGATVSAATHSPNAAIAIDGSVSTSVSYTLPDLDPSPFPSNSGSDHNHITSSTTYNASSDAYIHDIKAETAGITVSFTGGGPFHINKLEAQADDITFNFAAGTYYVDEFTVNSGTDNVTINITSGPVFFHIGSQFIIDGTNVNINTGGNVEDFLVYLHSGAKFDSKRSGLDFTGFIYGPSNVPSVLIDGDNNTFHGAINISGGEIKFNRTGTSFTYTAADQTAISNISTCPVVPDPILDYKFDACSLASTVEDSQGSYDGTATGTDSSDSASVLGGRSLDLSGTTTSDWVTVPKSAVSGLDNLSFSVWIKTATSASLQSIFHALGSGTGDEEFKIYLNYSNTVILKLRDTTETLSANKTLTDNAWHHLVITRQSSTVCLYVDGSQTDCDTGATTGTLSVNYANSVVIGQEQDSFRSSASLNSGFDSTQSFKGYIDELKIYNSALSSSQVQVLYTDETSGNNTSSCVADLIASYNFDDDWVSNNSLTDQTGSYNGTPSGSVSQISAGASGSKGDTCNAGSFSGGTIDVSGLPVSTSTGAKTSVSFWMYWDGTNNVSPLGWDKYNLWLINGYFGFNTWSFDLTGIYSSGLSSGWHHVAAVFTNGSVSNNKLYIDGALKTISNNSGYSIITSNTTVQSTLTMGGITSSINYRFSGKLDNFKIYNGTITQTQVTADMNESNACPSVNTPAVDFNCVENGSNGISGTLYTKTTAQLFSLDIIALRDASTVETSFADIADHTVTVELVDSNSAGSCSAYSVLSPAVSQSLLITSTDAGNKASASMNSSTAYSSVKCRVTDATDSPSVISCSSDNFAIRPATFSSVTSNMTNTGFTATPKAKAGDNFTLTASSTTGYTGTPKIDTTKVEAHSLAIQNGSITGSFTAASSAVATGSSFTYSEAGAFRFLTEGIYDDSFTAIDQAGDCSDDFSNTVVSGKVGCKFGNTANTAYFGRFTPDHFVVSASTDGVLSNACTGFTYTGQAFSYQSSPTLTITAYNGLTPAAVTQNHTGSYASGINATDFNVTAPTADTNQLGQDLSNKVNLSWTPGTPTLNDNGDGSHAFSFGSDQYTNTHEDNSLIAPFNNTIDLIFTNITDDDLIQATGLPHTVQASGTSIRYGRINIDNAHGSELVDLAMPLTAQYWNGNAWVLNNADQCSLLSLSLTDPLSTDGLTTAELCVLDSGSPGNSGLGCSTADTSSKKFNEPTTLSPGNFNLYFKAPGSGNIGSLDITASVANYLKFNWKDTGKIDPTARITFGIYKGNTNQIYFKEVY